MSNGRRAAIVEDDPACAEECAAELSEAGWECVRFSRAADALADARTGRRFDVVLMDLNLPGESAFDAIAELRRCSAASAVVAFTAHTADEYVFRAIRAGAVGYVLKHDDEITLAEVASIVEAGGAPVSRSIARRVLESMHVVEARPEEELTKRECDVLSLLARGLTYEEAAHALGISANTVRSHVRSSYEKLHAASKAEAVARALKRGLLS